MVEFVDASIQDLVECTIFLRRIKPKLCDKFVVGIEKIRDFDRNVTFHVLQPGVDEDSQIIMVSAEYILSYLQIPCEKEFSENESDS